MANATVDAYGVPITRHDDVPESGAWQSDPQLQQMLASLKSKGFTRDTLIKLARSQGRAGVGQQLDPATAALITEYQQLEQYVDDNRQRLGIPDNYMPAVENGQLWDPHQNSGRNAGIAAGVATGAALGGGLALGALSGGGGGAAAGTGAATGTGTGTATTGLTSAGLIPSSTVSGTALSSAYPAAVTSGATTGAASGGGSIFSQLLSNPTALGKGLSGLANSTANNRSTALDYDLLQQNARQDQTNSYWSQLANYNTQMMDREKTNADARSTNLKQIQQAEYLKNRTSGYTPKEGLPSYGFGYKASTPEVIDAASKTSAQLQPTFGQDAIAAFDKPTEPDPYTLSSQLPSTAKSSWWEKLLNVAAPAVTAYGATR